MPPINAAQTASAQNAHLGWSVRNPTALLVFADGSVLPGAGVGAEGLAHGEVCFNTAMTGYEEILTDPSYDGQILTFTFPHIGNVGVNDEDVEALDARRPCRAKGLILRAAVTEPSNFRATAHLNAWLKQNGVVGICGVDTRALAARIRESGMPNAIIAHNLDGVFDRAALQAQARALPLMAGRDLVPNVTCKDREAWRQTVWTLERGYGEATNGAYKVVALDYGVKRNILRLLTHVGCEVVIMPAGSRIEDILACAPDGVFLSNGPGDPAATGVYAVPVIQELLRRRVPIFGICLGHQLLALAIGAKTKKMLQGHHGANHPILDKSTGKVEIVSMNHGFSVDAASLPANARETHRSLFDGSNCGLVLDDAPAFSAQHHPEASPGPHDSHYLFERFVALMERRKKMADAL